MALMTGAAPDPKFTLLLGGTVTPTRRLFSQVAGSRTIAADSGMKHAAELGLAPELWVGDFDSASSTLQAAYPDTPRQVHPADKNKTDGELAAEAAISRGGRYLVLAGGLGGQMDHALGHLALLLRLAHSGIVAMATSGHEEAYPLSGRPLRIALEAGSRLSVIAFSDLAGLTIAGVRWPLAHADIGLGSTRTLSNVAEGPVDLAVQAGNAIVMAYPAML